MSLRLPLLLRRAVLSSMLTLFTVASSASAIANEAQLIFPGDLVMSQNDGTEFVMRLAAVATSSSQVTWPAGDLACR